MFDYQLKHKWFYLNLVDVTIVWMIIQYYDQKLLFLDGWELQQYNLLK